MSKEEDAPKDGEGLVEELHPLYFLCAGIFEFVAEGGAKDVIEEIVGGEVLRISTVSKGGGELSR